LPRERIGAISVNSSNGRLRDALHVGLLDDGGELLRHPARGSKPRPREKLARSIRAWSPRATPVRPSTSISIRRFIRRFGAKPIIAPRKSAAAALSGSAWRFVISLAIGWFRRWVYSRQPALLKNRRCPPKAARPARGAMASALPPCSTANAGTTRVPAAMVELAWLWLRWQPDSTLSAWFRERVGKVGGRIKKIMIVALARKLLIALAHSCWAGDRVYFLRTGPAVYFLLSGGDKSSQIQDIIRAKEMARELKEMKP
jgi:hypothetical protein